MKRKEYYFEFTDSEFCHTKDHFDTVMIESGLKEIEELPEFDG